MKKIQDYKNAFDAILEFEEALAKFTGAPYVVTTDCCTHAIEIAFRLTYQKDIVEFPAFTYLSVPMTLSKLNIPFKMVSERWRNNYQFINTKIWDSARSFGQNMYEKGQIQCISFGRTKPMALGRGGCLLTDNQQLYRSASRMRSDGRNLFQFNAWSDQQLFEEGYHYWMRPEDCVAGLNMLDQRMFTEQIEEFYNYPDCSKLKIKKYQKIEI